MVYGPSKPWMRMSPVLQIEQFIWGRTPFTHSSASYKDDVGLAWKKAGENTSTGTGLASLDTSFMVPEMTTSSIASGRAWRLKSNSVTPPP